MKKHGWFEIPGVQTGERIISERIAPLRPLLQHAKGASILDVGSAEGCISKWLIDEGAASFAHLVEKHGPWLETAREQMPNPPYNVRFSLADLYYWEDARSDGNFLPQGYDIVLALNVIQKVKEARQLMHDLVGMANKFFVYSGPADVLCDERSGMVPIDIRKELRNEFDCTHYNAGRRDPTKGHLGVRMIFKRKQGVANAKRGKKQPSLRPTGHN